MPAPRHTPKREFVKPLLGAFVCFLLFWIPQSVLVPAVQFFGGRLMGFTLGLLLAAAISTAFAMAIFESRPMTDLGLRWGPGNRRNLLIGLALGAVSAGLVVLAPVAFGMAHFTRAEHPDVSVLGDLFLPVMLACGAMAEELEFRGFIFQYLTRGWGPWAALLSTGVLFGLLHTGNPGSTLLSDVNTAFFGVLFGYAVLRTHDLWLPFGLHFAWNVTLPFGGTELSGLTIKATGYELVWNSGDLWSGGKYGPEASVLTTAVIVLLFLAVWKAPLYRSWAWLLDEAEESPEAISLDLSEPPASSSPPS